MKAIIGVLAGTVFLTVTALIILAVVMLSALPFAGAGWIALSLLNLVGCSFAIGWEACTWAGVATFLLALALDWLWWASMDVALSSMEVKA